MSQVSSRFRDRMMQNDLKQFRPEMDEKNDAALAREQFVCVLAMGLAVLIQLLVRKTELFHETLYLFGMTALTMALNLLIRRRTRKRATLFLYLWTAFILISDAVFETAVEPNKLGVIFMILLLALPGAILDAPLRVVSFTVLTSAVYVILSLFRFRGGIFLSNLIRLILVNLLVGAGNLHSSEVQIDLIRQNRAAQKTAEHDGLTWILNRRGGEATIDRCLQKGESGAFILIDVDNFKHINDTYGHNVGDLVLQSVAAVVGAIFRSSDVVMRLGGDEFIVYARNLQDERAVRRKIEEIHDEIRDITLSEEDNDCVSVSIGCVINRGEYPDYSSIYAAADELQYRSKKSGKNRYCIK